MITTESQPAEFVNVIVSEFTLLAMQVLRLITVTGELLLIVRLTVCTESQVLLPKKVLLITCELKYQVPLIFAESQALRFSLVCVVLLIISEMM